jgi:predicted aldo/keto reductase-like oxidoreductase
MNAGAFEKMKTLGLIEKMEQAKQQGRIGHIGFSFHDTQPVFKEIIDFYDWDMAQIQYNYMDTGIQATTDGLKYAHDKGIAVVVMEPVKGGMLANPPQEAIEVIEQASSKRKPVDWALQFLWNMPEVATVLSGMSTMQQVIENCDSADQSGVNSLNKEENQVLNQLAEIYQSKILVPCTTCDYCMPCPHGVNIPQNFAILNNVSLETNSLRRWRTARNYKKLAGSADKINKIKPNGNGAMCIDCGECLEKCPQEINIPIELGKVHKVLGNKERIADHFY